MKKRKKISVTDIVVYTILMLIALVILYPLYFTVIASFSEPYEVVNGNVFLWIKGFTLDSYKQVFQMKEIWVGYRNTIFYTVCGTMLALFLTLPAAYALSKKFLALRNLVVAYFMITMYFGGGLLPTYLQVKNMHLINKPYTLIIIGAFSVYNLIVAKTYFGTSIPGSLYEAAEIDGCTQFRQFVRIALPLAKPIIAVITLYYAVGYWNCYFNALIYVSDSDYYTLQLVLTTILSASSKALTGLNSETVDNMEVWVDAMRKQYIAEAMKYSIIIIASLPMLIIYPFIQKYFVKGIMLGSVKE